MLCNLEHVSLLVENQKRRNIFFHGSHLDSELLINNGSFGSSGEMRGLEGLQRALIQDQLRLEHLIDSGQGFVQ